MFKILSHHRNPNQSNSEIPFHLTPVRMSMIKNTDDSLCWKGCRVRKHSSIAGESANLYSHFGNQYGDFSENQETIYFKTQQYRCWVHTPKTLNHITRTCVQLCSQQHYFVKARTWKQPRYPSTKEWIKKMWYIYTMECYTAVKNNGILKFAGKWTDLEKTTLREVTQKDIICIHS